MTLDPVRDLVEARGARLVFLPSHSPDFNPIEHAQSAGPSFQTCTLRI